MKYEDLVDFDILNERVIQMISSGPFQIRKSDHKIVQELPSGIEPRSPWIFEPGEDARLCRKWNQIFFQMYGIIPRECFNCWKVVVRPKTLKDLLSVRKVQKKLGISAKCGMEERKDSSYKGLYAAFWYCPLDGGLKTAQDIHKQVERAVHHEIGVQHNVILKRACTEMEDAVGPSDKWIFPPVQHMVENYLDAVWEVYEQERVQPDYVKIHILRRWIEYARENRDPSVSEFIEDANKAFRIVKTSRYEESEKTASEQFAIICKEPSEWPSFQGLSDYL